MTSTPQQDETQTPLAPRAATRFRRAAAAGTVGTVVEFYDFGLYGLLAVVFASRFFPAQNPVTSTLEALAVIGAGYLSRPVGGMIFGLLGDRIGRRPVLIASLILMGLSSTLIGVLPTYSTIGVLAPALLVLLRVFQGISAGGEVAGAQTYVVESAPRGSRGLFGSLPALGSALGAAAAFLVAAIVALSLGPDQLAAWGWRIPFLLCLPLTLICLWMRLSLEDTPEFESLVANKQVAKAPVREVLRHHLGPVTRVALLTIANLGPLQLGQTYMVTHLRLTKHMPTSTIYVLLGVCILVTIPAFLYAGRLSDRIGRRRSLLIGFSLKFILAVPAFVLIGTLNGVVAIALVVLIFNAPVPLVGSSVYTTFTELFPTRVRFTGVALGFNVGTIIASGFGPYIAAQLVASTNWPVAAAFWGVATAGLGLLTLIGLPETSGKELKR